MNNRHFLFAVGLLLLAVAINPVGYQGGGADDEQYLAAVRCWIAHGPCLPSNHWEGRWPLIGLLSGSVALFGESRWSLAAVPLAISIVCLALLYRIVSRLFDERSALTAACLLAITPVFALQALDPMVEPLELAFILSGFLAVLQLRDGRSAAAFVAGLCFAMAVQVRETALAIGPFALTAFALTVRGQTRPWLLAALGFALPFIVELLWFAAQTGDPFFRRRLSMAHTSIATVELHGRSTVEGSPLFNRELIANWRHQPGISIHWSIDGLVNLFANQATAYAFLLFPALALWGKRRLPLRAWHLSKALFLCAIGYAVILIYVFSIDPKPRMMFVPLAAVILASAPLHVALWKQKRSIAIALWLAIGVVSMLTILSAPPYYRAEEATERWTEARPGQIETIQPTRTTLAFLPVARSLPDAGAGRPFLLIQVGEACSNWARRMKLAPMDLYVAEQFPLSALGSLDRRRKVHLCLYRYGSDAGRAKMAQMAKESRS